MDTKKAVKDAPAATLAATEELLRAPAAAPLVPLPLEILVPEARQQTPAVRQRAQRPDCRLHGLGQTKYIDDMYLPGMLYAKIKRAGVASARIISIDTKEAEAMPGVVAVITGKDVPCNTFGPSLKDQPVLADARVFHAGDGVAAVAAITEQIAADALEKIKVEYEVLRPVARSARIAQARDARSARAEPQHLRPQDHQEGRRREGLRGVRSHLRGQLSHADGRARAARAALVARDVGCQWPRHDLFHARTDHARSRRRRAHAGHADEPRPHRRHDRRRQLRRQERDHDRAGRGAPGEEDRATGEVHLHAPRGVHLLDDAAPAHHGLQDRGHEARQDPGAEDSPGPRRRRLLLVERDDARQGVHSVGGSLQHRQPLAEAYRRLHEQDDDGRDAWIRGAAGMFCLRVAHG